MEQTVSSVLFPWVLGFLDKNSSKCVIIICTQLEMKCIHLLLYTVSENLDIESVFIKMS